jgi:hypothetical protein
MFQSGDGDIEITGAAGLEQAEPATSRFFQILAIPQRSQQLEHPRSLLQMMSKCRALISRCCARKIPISLSRAR